MELITKLKGNQTILNGGLFSIFSFFNQGIAFLLLILLANYIAPAEYGKLSLFNTIVQFLGFFIALSTQGYLSVSYFKRGDQFFKKDFSSICAISIVVTILLCVICFILGNWIAKQASLSKSFIWLAIFISFFQLFQNMMLDYQRIKERIGKYGIISCGSAILNFALSLYLIIKLNLDWEGRVYAQTICAFLFGGFAVFYFAKNKLYTIHLSWDNLKYIILWGLPLIPHLASVWIKQGGDRFIINHFHSVDDVGLFSFALNLTSVIIIVGTAFNSTNSVSIFKILSDDNITKNDKILKIQKQTKTITIITIISYIFITAGASFLVPLLLPRYSSSIPYFLILSIQGLGQCFYLLYCNYLFYYSKNKQIMYVTFFTSLLHLCLSLVFTRYSLYATSVIYVFSQFLVSYLIYKLSMKAISQNLN